MRCWPTEHHFASWLTLAPHNKISGGKRLGSRTQPSANRAAKILRLAAMALVRGDHALGAFYRRLAARTDKPTAMTATARKLALLVYRMLTYNMPYQHTSAAGGAFLMPRQHLLHEVGKHRNALGYRELIDLKRLQLRRRGSWLAASAGLTLRSRTRRRLTGLR